jgi:hypothetical protein
MRITSKSLIIFVVTILCMLPFFALSSPVDQMHNNPSPFDFLTDKDGHIYMVKDNTLHSNDLY